MDGLTRRRVVLVTGAARGIGLAVARRFTALGDHVVIGDVDGDAALAAAEGVAGAQAGVTGAGVVEGAQVDVTSTESVDAWIADVLARAGRVDVAVNNAGVQLNRAFLDLGDDDWDHVLGVNLDGAFRVSRAVGRAMCRQGGGAIVNVSSIADRFGMPRRIPYGVTKAGIDALTRGLAAEWAPHGVRVNAVAPGYVETDLVRHAFEMGHIDRAAIEAKIPMGRLTSPASIAKAVTWLASDDADYVTGHVLYVDGGYAIYK